MSARARWLEPIRVPRGTRTSIGLLPSASSHRYGRHLWSHSTFHVEHVRSPHPSSSFVAMRPRTRTFSGSSTFHVELASPSQVAIHVHLPLFLAWSRFAQRWARTKPLPFFLVRAEASAVTRTFMACIHVPRGTVRPSASFIGLLRGAHPRSTWNTTWPGSDRSTSWRQGKGSARARRMRVRVPRGTRHGLGADRFPFMAARPARRRHAPQAGGRSTWNTAWPGSDRFTSWLRDQRDNGTRRMWMCGSTWNTAWPRCVPLHLMAARPSRRRRAPHVDVRFDLEHGAASVRTSPPSWR
ncbi:hypothetical protein SAMN05443572_114154 [Myxococcus fulvus]|uniref:Uncharacterized protein n=1 Tax=Myxococcus fulvus TaxID=33 RepID=A0ABY1CW66_MYXFU|nr:hypothetical protein SAMN05443572_114154 [Myxococcus fulvus]